MTTEREVLASYASSLHRAIAGVLIGHMPAASSSQAIQDATRTMAVGVLGLILGKLILAADDRSGKGGRAALLRLARETIDRTVEDQPENAER